MPEKVKPCPHASAANTGIYHDLRVADVDGDGLVSVVCSCGAAGAPEVLADDAIRLWNDRPREEALESLLREARAVIKCMDKNAPRADKTCDEPGITYSEAACRELRDNGTILFDGYKNGTFLPAIDAALKEETSGN